MNINTKPKIKRKTKKLAGVGINDSDYRVYSYIKDEQGNRVGLIKCPYYYLWETLIKKCYGNNKKGSSSYNVYQSKQVTVCEEWHRFSNFLSWAKGQLNITTKGYVLDKDLLQYYTDKHFKGKVYSPDTCVVIPSFINNFIKSSKGSRGESPLGVSKDKKAKSNTYNAMISDKGVLIPLGRYPTAYEAHDAWRDAKIKLCFKYLDTIDCVIARTAFLNFTYKMMKHKAEGKVTDY